MANRARTTTKIVMTIIAVVNMSPEPVNKPCPNWNTTPNNETRNKLTASFFFSNKATQPSNHPKTANPNATITQLGLFSIKDFWVSSSASKASCVIVAWDIKFMIPITFHIKRMIETIQNQTGIFCVLSVIALH